MRIFFYTFLIVIFVSCSSEDKIIKDNSNVLKLQNRITEDSLLLASLHNEMDNINNVLDTANLLNENFKSGVSMKRKDVLEKIQTINMLLNESNGKIEKLEKELQVSKSSVKNNSVIQSAVSTKKTEIAGAKNYFSQLEKDITKLRSENVNLIAIIRQKESEMIVKDNVIAKIKAEREIQEQKLTEVINRIALMEQKVLQAEKDLEISKQEAKKQKAKTYYDTGLELKNIYDNVSGLSTLFGGKSTKKDLIKQAYSYLKKSYEMGYPDAKREILILETDKKYSKNLD